MLARLLRIVKRLITYEAWRILTVEASRAKPPIGLVDIRRIEDPRAMHRQAPEEIRRADCHREGAIGFAAWKDGAVAGVCWLWPGPLLGRRPIGEQPGDCAEIIQITVAERARGCGIAPELIKAAACELRDAGYRRLYAQIWHSNVASLKAFRKCGWDEVGWSIALQPRFRSRALRISRLKPEWRGRDGLLPNW